MGRSHAVAGHGRLRKRTKSIDIQQLVAVSSPGLSEFQFKGIQPSITIDHSIHSCHDNRS